MQFGSIRYESVYRRWIRNLSICGEFYYSWSSLYYQTSMKPFRKSSSVKVERVKQMELDGNKLSTKFMIRYTLRQLMEGSVLTQTIISTGILPVSSLNSSSLSFPGGPTGI